MTKLAFFDCDSTLSSIEGIDELARLRGPEILQEVESLTNDAMDGKVPLGDVFGKRIDIIKPDADSCKIVQQLYIDTVEPSALEVINELKSKGWTPAILSGGFKPLIEPLAQFLGIDIVEAVPLHLNEDGSYLDFGRNYQTTRNGGKPEIIREIIKKNNAEKVIMIGDGISDLECQPHVDAFFGYGGYVERQRVKDEAQFYVMELKQMFKIANWL